MRSYTKQIITLILLMSSFLSIIHLQLTTSISRAQADCSPCSISQAPPIGEPSPGVGVQSAWVIIVGDTWDHDDMPLLQNDGNKIYNTLRGVGFSSEQIYYLGPEVGPSQPYVNTSSTKINIQYAIENWAAERVNSTQSLGISITTHGDQNALAVMVADALRDYELNSYLNNFEATTGCDRVILLIESCYSGSLMDPLSKSNRIIVTSANIEHGAGFNPQETGGAFTESFWSSIASCSTIGRAFEGAVAHLKQLQIFKQEPWIDDNHDEIGHPTDQYFYLPNGGDGLDALNVKIWPKPRICLPRIQIEMIPLPWYEIWDPLTSIVNIGVEVQSSTGISNVYARFVPSGWEPYDPHDGSLYPIGEGVLLVELFDHLGSGIYSGDAVFNDLNLGDSFKVNILAYDANGIIANTESTWLSFNADGEAPPDTEPPTIAITKPHTEDAVSETIEIIARGDDNQELESIALYIDDLLIDNISMPDYYPYPELHFMCNTSQYEDGSHNITAVAIDHEGLTNQTSVFVTFDNGSNNLIYYAVFIGGGAIVILTCIAIRANKKKRRKTNKGKGKKKKK